MANAPSGHKLDDTRHLYTGDGVEDKPRPWLLNVAWGILIIVVCGTGLLLTNLRRNRADG